VLKEIIDRAVYKISTRDEILNNLLPGLSFALKTMCVAGSEFDAVPGSERAFLPSVTNLGTRIQELYLLNNDVH